MKTNCPNCGAPITSSKCEYCGTIHFDFNRNLIEPMIIKQNVLIRQMEISKLYAEALLAMRKYAGEF